MAIALRKKDEIEKLRRTGAIVAQTLEYLQDIIKPGITLTEIDRLGEEFIIKQGKAIF